MTLFLDRAVSRAIDELPREINYAANRFIDDIGDLAGGGMDSSIVISYAPHVRLEADQKQLSRVVSDMARSDILLRETPDPHRKLDLPSFILEADDLSDPILKSFMECFPNAFRRNEQLRDAVGSAAMGLVGLHGVLRFPDTFSMTLEDDNYGAEAFKLAVKGLRDKVLKPMARQIPRS